MSLTIVELAAAVLPGTDEGQKVLAYVKTKYAEEQAPAAPAVEPAPEAPTQAEGTGEPGAPADPSAQSESHVETESAQ